VVQRCVSPAKSLVPVEVEVVGIAVESFSEIPIAVLAKSDASLTEEVVIAHCQER